MNIATQIAIDFYSSIDEFDSAIEATENFLDIIKSQANSHVSNSVMDTYNFRDNSSISFTNNNYTRELGKIVE
jgi:hypothetical protein